MQLPSNITTPCGVGDYVEPPTHHSNTALPPLPLHLLSHESPAMAEEALMSLTAGLVPVVPVDHGGRLSLASGKNAAVANNATMRMCEDPTLSQLIDQ